LVRSDDNLVVADSFVIGDLDSDGIIEATSAATVEWR
jgi:hypothetical protein